MMKNPLINRELDPYLYPTYKDIPEDARRKYQRILQRKRVRHNS